MIQVTKQAVQQWVMIDLLAQKHRFQDTVLMFERKYEVKLDVFEKHFETAEKEIFEEWDDYIDWKAAHEFLIRIDEEIQDTKQGNIEVIN